ncbi:DUF4054 domain-containing protein [Methylobacterium sp. WSM2598]|uniref:DUF4054 domain-containing protein n=1 Tax=Methylobacterium sp. WSM2598 TaxID=398261 RepID=UPI000364AEB9|nr:DUF4054 domain-containing protein [Methylobacterium sp. WSM2598]
MEAPAPAELKARFPVFAGLPDEAVAPALAEARARVDAALPQAGLARMLYAAHLLTLDGHGGAEGAWIRAGRPRLLRSGTLTVERRGAGEAGPDPAGTLAETSYGRRFRDLLRLTSPGIAVV